jgi:hypothetical protein
VAIARQASAKPAGPVSTGNDPGLGFFEVETGSDDLADEPAEAPHHNGAVNPAFPNLPDREYATGMQAEPRIDGQITAKPGTDGFIHENAREAAKNGEKLYDGSTCPTCSSNRMVRNGTCKVCLDCGTTTGCS